MIIKLYMLKKKGRLSLKRRPSLLKEKGRLSLKRRPSLLKKEGKAFFFSM
jgi:hypothetical protein